MHVTADTNRKPSVGSLMGAPLRVGEHGREQAALRTATRQWPSDCQPAGEPAGLGAWRNVPTVWRMLRGPQISEPPPAGLRPGRRRRPTTAPMLAPRAVQAKRSSNLRRGEPFHSQGAPQTVRQYYQGHVVDVAGRCRSSLSKGVVCTELVSRTPFACGALYVVTIRANADSRTNPHLASGRAASLW